MDYDYKHFDNYEALYDFNKSLAQELLKDVGEGDWQNEDIYYYPTIEDYTIYELIEGWYADHDFDDVGSAPNPLDYIDFDAFGKALTNTWDDSVYWTNDTVVLSTNYGW